MRYHAIPTKNFNTIQTNNQSDISSENQTETYEKQLNKYLINDMHQIWTFTTDFGSLKLKFRTDTFAQEEWHKLRRKGQNFGTNGEKIVKKVRIKNTYHKVGRGSDGLRTSWWRKKTQGGSRRIVYITLFVHTKRQRLALISGQSRLLALSRHIRWRRWNKTDFQC